MSNSTIPAAVNSPTTSNSPVAITTSAVPVTSFSTSVGGNQQTSTVPAVVSTSVVTVSDTPAATSSNSPQQQVTSQVPTVVTSEVIVTQTSNGGQTVVIVTHVSTTIAPTVVAVGNGATGTSSSAASASSTAGSVQTDGKSTNGSSSSASTIAPAVVVPVVVIALLVLAGIWFFRKRKANKEAEDLRRKEVEEYGFNPNEGATLGGAGAGTMATNDNAAAMSEVDGSGYRGWGNTNAGRKASTTLGSGSVGAGAIGIARSDSGGNAGYANGQHSPNGGYSDHNSGDPLVNGNSRPISQDFEGVAALGGAPAAGSRSNTGVRRGPSNASSAYSGGQRSDTSNEGGATNSMGSPTWGNEYLNEVEGPYAGQAGGAPVIRDVSARRNTRIESPSVLHQQARGGISQNF